MEKLPRVLLDRVLVLFDGAVDKSEGGILIPETAQQKSLTGTIKAVGPGRRLENGELSEMPVAVGEKVTFGRYSGTEMRYEGVDYLVLRMDDIVAVH